MGFYDMARNAFTEGANKAKESNKNKFAKKQKRMAEIKASRTTLESHNKISSDLRAEKGKLREAKLESFGFGKKRRKAVASGILKVVDANSKRFKKPKGKGKKYKPVDLW